MADTTVHFPGPGSGGTTVPIKATDNLDGTFALQFSAELTVDPTNLNLEATQVLVKNAAVSALATQGATTGAAVITDANGTLQQYLRGLIVLTLSQATSAKQDTAQTALDAIAAALGTTADAAWTTGNGTVIALLKAIATNTIPPLP